MKTTMNKIVMSFVIFVSLGLILSVHHVSAACDQQKAMQKLRYCQKMLTNVGSSNEKCRIMKQAVSCLKEAVSYCDQMKPQIDPFIKAVEKQVSKACGAGAACDQQKAKKKFGECQKILSKMGNASTTKAKCLIIKDAVSCLKKAVSYCDQMKPTMDPIIKALEKQVSQTCGAGAA